VGYEGGAIVVVAVITRPGGKGEGSLSVISQENFDKKSTVVRDSIKTTGFARCRSHNLKGNEKRWIMIGGR
jgi:hypothetical protein